jgi:cobalt-zinc-cadmium efflux system outer membrane protein
MHRVVCAALVACLGGALPAGAQIVLTFDDALARAREQSAAVRVARARIAEAEAALVDASARFRDNPVIEASGGRRGSALSTTELEIGVSQQFETGGQRTARVSRARAAVDRQRAASDAAVRGAVLDAATAFLRGLAARERASLAEEASAVSGELLDATQRRYAAGDIAAIDVNLARIDAARADAALGSARADLAGAVGELRAILDLPAGEPIELEGSLDLPPLPPLEQLETSVDGRPELAALLADVREAEAQAELGRALARPDLGLRVAYEREETNDIVIGGLSVTLPAFQQGRGTLAAGLAQANRARLELEAERRLMLAELRTAYSVFTQRRAVAAALRQDAAPSVADNEALGRRSYEAGEMNLMDLLLIRHDAVDTTSIIIDRTLDAALSRLNVAFLAGVLP